MFLSQPSSTSKKEHVVAKAFAFNIFRDKRPKLDPKDYSISDVTGETVGKLPGELNGQQFIIQNCQVLLKKLLDMCGGVYPEDKQWYRYRVDKICILTSNVHKL